MAAKLAVLAVVVLLVGAFAAGLLFARGTSVDERQAAETVEPTVEPVATQPPPPRRQPLRQAFGHTCGACHTLRAAGSRGLFGPDLDALKPSRARVRRILRTGSIDGVMQPNLLTGRDAKRMAAYVARVAGRPRR